MWATGKQIIFSEIILDKWNGHFMCKECACKVMVNSPDRVSTNPDREVTMLMQEHQLHVICIICVRCRNQFRCLIHGPGIDLYAVTLEQLLGCRNITVQYLFTSCWFSIKHCSIWYRLV